MSNAGTVRPATRRRNTPPLSTYHRIARSFVDRGHRVNVEVTISREPGPDDEVVREWDALVESLELGRVES